MIMRMSSAINETLAQRHRHCNMSAMEEINPYAAPKAEVLVTDADASRVRQEHLRTESHLKALGWVIVVLSISTIVSAWMTKRIQWREFGLQPGLEVIPRWQFVMTGARIVAGLGMMRLLKWAGTATIVLSAIELIVNVLHLPYSLAGIIAHAFILRFLFQKQTRFIFTEPYQAVLQQTPMLKSPVATWGLLVLLILLLNLFIAMWATFR